MSQILDGKKQSLQESKLARDEEDERENENLVRCSSLRSVFLSRKDIM